MSTTKRTNKPARGENRVPKILGELLYIVIVVFLVKNCVAGPYQIPSGSMEKTLLVGDYLFVNQFIYGVKTPSNIPFTDIHLPRYTLFPALRNPKGGDIVVFAYPGDRDQVQSDEAKYLIKRCVGTPGDTIEVKSKDLYVDGKLFPKTPGMQFINHSSIPKEDYYPNLFPRGMQWNPDNYGPLRVPKKGDAISLTAQNFPQWETFIGREGHKVELQGSTVMVDGKPIASYTVEHDYYFMMGDNRDNSEDSRYWGFVQDDAIVGEPMFCYWSWNQDIPVTNIVDKIASVRWGRIGQLIR